MSKKLLGLLICSTFCIHFVHSSGFKTLSNGNEEGAPKHNTAAAERSNSVIQSKLNIDDFIQEAGCRCKNGKCVMEGKKEVCKCPPEYGYYDGIITKECTPCKCGKESNCTIYVPIIGKAKITCICKVGYKVVSNRCTGPCTSNPCLSGGTCTDIKNGFKCICPSGYSGAKCESKVSDPCTSKPCLNNGKCKVEGKSFKCTCVEPYNGTRCENDPCTLKPCLNGGTCTLDGKNFKCACISPYNGKKCESDPCTSKPCLNSGKCKVEGKSFKCTCIEPYNGTRCEKDPCTLKPCLNGGTCTLDGKNFKCACISPYNGKKCESDPCTSKPCLNSGKCKVDGKSFKCTCIEPYNGTRCENDPCTSKPCLNSGKCKVEGKNFKCTCVEPYNGTRCENDPCTLKPCLNGGTCTLDGKNFKCTCISPFNGKKCESDPCNPNKCKHDGACTIKGISYACECKGNFWGDTCEKECKCGNGDCKKDVSGKMDCVCPTEFGKYTEHTCEACKCGKGANCTFDPIFLSDNKKCICPNGYKETDGICDDACTSQPCRNGGTCLVVGSAYKCNCEKPYSGPRCENDPCTNIPCKNNGTCKINGNSFKCDCKPPFSGNTCATDPCTSNPCKHGGLCKLDGKSFKCDCKDPYFGNTCEQKCECKDGKCEKDSSNNLKCVCSPGYGLQSTDTCKECKCGENANCTFTSDWLTGYDKTCVCPKGYKEVSNYCKEISTTTHKATTSSTKTTGSVTKYTSPTTKSTSPSPSLLASTSYVSNTTTTSPSTSTYASKSTATSKITYPIKSTSRIPTYEPSNFTESVTNTKTYTPSNFTFDYNGTTYVPSNFTGDWNRTTYNPSNFTFDYNRTTYAPSNFTGDWDRTTYYPSNFTFDYNGTTYTPSNFTGDWDRTTYNPSNFTFDYNRTTYEPSNFTFDFNGTTYIPSNFTDDYTERTYEQSNFTFEYNGTTNEPSNISYTETLSTAFTEISHSTRISDESTTTTEDRNSESTTQLASTTNEPEPDICDKNHCQNGGTCILTKDGPKCQCVYPYGGETCADSYWCTEGMGKTVCPEGTCRFNFVSKIGRCECPKDQYFHYDKMVCEVVDKCPQMFGKCNGQNEICRNGNCQCAENYKRDNKNMCMPNFCESKPYPCGENETCKDVESDPGNVKCTCKENFFFNGKLCQKGDKCSVPSILGCEQICKPETQLCECKPGFTLQSNKKSCKPSNSTTLCKKPCGVGICIISDAREICICPGTHISNGSSCIDVCSANLVPSGLCPNNECLPDETLGFKCKCQGKLVYDENGVTCRKKLMCTEGNGTQICGAKMAHCAEEFSSVDGFKCECPKGEDMDSDGICKGKCTLPKYTEDCEKRLATCDMNGYEAICKCPPMLTFSADGRCIELENASYIGWLPLEQQRYFPKKMFNSIPLSEVQDNDYTNITNDIRASMQLLYGKNYKFADVLKCQPSEGKVKCLVEIQFHTDPKDQVKLISDADTCVSMGSTTCFIPPGLVLYKKDIKPDMFSETDPCQKEIKELNCGFETNCKRIDSKSRNFECSCFEGFESQGSRRPFTDYKTIIHNCEDIDECQKARACPNRTRCLNTYGSYECPCKDGFRPLTAKSDTKSTGCVEVCNALVCNHGNCEVTGDKYRCRCNAGYKGLNCDQEDVNVAGAGGMKVALIILSTIVVPFILLSAYMIHKYRLLKKTTYKSSYLDDQSSSSTLNLQPMREGSDDIE